MPLSEHEQRILDEIERRLAAEDPKFARSTSAATPRGVAMKRVKQSVVGFCLGLGLLLAGLFAGIDSPSLLVGFGLAGFLVMLLSITLIARAYKEVSRISVRSSGDPGWFNRAEERWKKRFERPEEH